MIPLLKTLLAFSFVTYVILAAIVWPNRREPLHRAFFYTAATVALWMLFFGLELFSEDYQIKLWCHRFRYIFVAWSSPLWYLCIMRFGVHSHAPPPTMPIWLIIVTSITSTLSLSDSYQSLFHYDFSMQSWGQFKILSYSVGPWFRIHTLLSLAVLALSLLHLFRLAQSSRSVFFYRRTLLLSFVTLIPTFLTITYSIGWEPIPGYSVIPFVFSLNGIAEWFALFHYRFLGFAPISREAIFPSLSEAILVFDLNDVLVDFNNAADTLPGFEHPLQTGAVSNNIFVQAGFVEWFGSYKSSRQFIFTINDNEFVLEMSCHLFHNDSDEPMGKILLVRDITEVYLAGKTLSESEERYRTLMEASPFPLFIIDHENHEISYVNSQVLEWSGLKMNELIGRSPKGFYVDTKKRDLALAELAAKGRIDALEVDFRLAQGRIATCLMSARQLKFAGKKSALICLVDITELRMAEKANIDLVMRNRELIIVEEQQQRIGRDLHDDLGQQLTGISYLLGALKNRIEDNRPDEASQIDQLHKNLQKVISQVRTMAHGLNPIDLHGTGLWHALLQTLNSLSSSARLECVLLPTEPLFIASAESSIQLFRIAQEALQNSVRHGQPTKITVRLEMHTHHGEMTISDNGVGFDHTIGSTFGNGLKIMQFRASLVHGTLKINTNKGLGTVVSLIFPIIHPSAAN